MKALWAIIRAACNWYVVEDGNEPLTIRLRIRQWHPYVLAMKAYDGMMLTAYYILYWLGR